MKVISQRSLKHFPDELYRTDWFSLQLFWLMTKTTTTTTTIFQFDNSSAI